jgi:exodeoxyribonuclease VII large subunit
MPEKLSLTELQLIIRDSLYMSLPQMFWVIAEISELKENYAGHCYLELIEKHPDEKNIRARVRAVVWNKRYGFLKSFFENVTGESLREGLKILVKTKVEYHEVYGLSLVISDIDPTFTIGEMAMKRQLVIKRLEQEGVFTMNKEIDFPLLPQRIAIISSRTAAGYSDFINHLHGNNFGYVFYTALIESAMQGAETESGILNALDKIAENAHLFDLVVIIRGGGSQTDLSWFDSYNIAYYVTQFPLPVLTGIGHDKDMSVTDMVANMALKTPTAVADFIIDTVAGLENHLMEQGKEIMDLAQEIIGKNKNWLESSGSQLVHITRMMISDSKDRLSEKIIKIINVGKEYTFRAGLIPANQSTRLASGVTAYSNMKRSFLVRSSEGLKSLTLSSLEASRKKVQVLEKSLDLMNPEKVLLRGYTITSCNGKIIKKSDELRTDDLIDTQFSDGNVKSRILETNKML